MRSSSFIEECDAGTGKWLYGHYNKQRKGFSRSIVIVFVAAAVVVFVAAVVIVVIVVIFEVMVTGGQPYFPDIASASNGGGSRNASTNPQIDLCRVVSSRIGKLYILEKSIVGEEGPAYSIIGAIGRTRSGKPSSTLASLRVDPDSAHG